MAWVPFADRDEVGESLVSRFWDRRVHMALLFVYLDREEFVVGSKRGTAHHLPEGRFAVPDPDDPGQMAYWRVESTKADGSRKELRPWPADVRWAPLRPPYPDGLDTKGRREWSQRWYDDVYFEWKDAVIAAIAAGPQAAADEFARSSPAAELPPPVTKRPRVRVRPKPVSAKQRQIAAERLMAEALRRVGMSERQVAAELQLPKTTAHRRLEGAPRLASEVSLLLVEMQIERLLSQIGLLAARAESPEDRALLAERMKQVRRLQELVAGGEPAGPTSSGSLGVFGPPLVGGANG